MTKEELAEKIAELKRVEPANSLPETFVQRVPAWNAIHFLRPAADDVVLLASVKNAPADEYAFSHAARVLGFAVENLDKLVGAPVVRLEPFESGEAKFDTFLAFGPSIAKFHIGDGYFLKTRTIDCCAINHIEFSGDETEAEAVVRSKHIVLPDITREITPVIFARYQKETGQKSEQFLAILKRERTGDYIRQLPRDGGVVEFENWERARMTLTAEQGSSTIELTFSGETKTVSVDEALKLMDELVLRGAESAKKIW